VSSRPRHLLHIFSTFVPAGPEMRTVNLIGGLGREFRHSIVAMDGRTDARERLTGDADVRLLPSPPRAGSVATIRALRNLIRAEEPDLVLSYNWGAFDSVFATQSLRFRAHVHHEDGFNADEVSEFKQRRVLARRWFLPRVRRVVVPSKNLRRIATETWKLAPELVRYIPNGIRLDRFKRRDGHATLRERFRIPRSALVAGYVGHLRPEKNPLRFVQAIARIERAMEVHALVLGDGPERAAIEKFVAATPSLAERVHLVGHQSDPAEFYRAMDLFALSSDTEQMPVALIEAMASSLPCVSTDVGDVRDILPDAQAEFIVPTRAGDTTALLAEKMSALLAASARREELGAKNRAQVESRFAFDGMLAAYRDVYDAAMAR
jgi:glycosyltransferase involved in cell wall biosynthesis